MLIALKYDFNYASINYLKSEVVGAVAALKSQIFSIKTELALDVSLYDFSLWVTHQHFNVSKELNIVFKKSLIMKPMHHNSIIF